jgi:hypothetical protein
MSYVAEWLGGVSVFGIVLLLLIVPWFAAIAVVVATIAVLVVALAVLASPYLIVRSVRRRLPNEEHDRSTRRAWSGADRPPGRLRAWAEHT